MIVYEQVYMFSYYLSIWLAREEGHIMFSVTDSFPAVLYKIQTQSLQQPVLWMRKLRHREVKEGARVTQLVNCESVSCSVMSDSLRPHGL